MREDRNRSAEVTVFACRLVDGCEQLSTGTARRQQFLRDLTVPPQERRRDRSGLVASARRGFVRAVEQQIGDAAKRGGDNHERTGMRGDDGRRSLNGGGVGERGAAEFPDFEI